MYNFKNDYSDGAHPDILEKLMQSMAFQEAGYGEDQFSLDAKAVLAQQMSLPEAEIHLVTGGTQANLVVTSALLRPHEAVISATTGHIFANEAGAIEATGHKVLSVSSPDGKLSAELLGPVLAAHRKRPHVVKPRLVYISNSTETGTIYRASELQDLSDFCRRENLLLFMDGARLGYALTAEDNDLDLATVARLCDVFYIGGTKCGAMFGEAIVVPRPLPELQLDYIIKQKGALLAKGRFLGIQFLTLFQNGLYFRLAGQGNAHAARIAVAIRDCGFDFLYPPESNQLFPVLPLPLIRKLEKNHSFYLWQQTGEHTAALRLVTSWATPAQGVNDFISDLRRFG